ncbi:glucose/galactose transporter [Gluconacetobacter johannae DSM 13595]|uniref:Glucose/galactose MFS transporter n=1 Tax=Gluconacetobacter johannae TaxID=112140 RepID=A0A7W4P5Y5_9PROT|nr:glucose/galactose MFS transporter [Gluconacetobacter johannae]MBB2175320.1 glucose/galactose MFS transporter [Gluconacetobacter johannae]GBQ85814.1 glucose/galactose transporter [Gluconacetobacter johannae DSM 13595]
MPARFQSPAGPYGWLPIVMLGGLFFMIGFVTWLNGPLISFVQVAFDISDVSAFLVPLVFYLSYFLFPVPASFITARTGLKKGLALALVVMAAGAVLFGQFISLRWYPGALGGLVVLGAGLSLLQITVNPYVSILGPIESAAQRIAIMGVCNKFAGIVAPIALALLVMRDIGGVANRIRATTDPVARDRILDGFTHAVYLPYLGMALILLLAAAWVRRSSLPDIALDAPARAETTTAAPRGRLLFGVLGMFLYVGVEVMAGDAIGTYGRGFGLPLDTTKFFTSLTLAAMMLGYVGGLLCVPRLLSQERCLVASAATGILLTVCAFLSTGYASVACVALLGLANAMIMPTLFPISIRDMGSATGRASAYLVMAFSGGAVLPQIFVALKQGHDFQAVFAGIMIPAYLYILLFGLHVLKGRATRQATAPLVPQ